jgi:hypothetical protein
MLCKTAFVTAMRLSRCEINDAFHLRLIVSGFVSFVYVDCSTMSVVVTLNLEYEPDCQVAQLNEDEHNAFLDVQQLLLQHQYRNFVMTKSKTSDEFAHWRPNLQRIKTQLATAAAPPPAAGLASGPTQLSEEVNSVSSSSPSRRKSSAGTLQLERRVSSPTASPLSVKREQSMPALLSAELNTAAKPPVLARERSSPVLARERASVLDQSPLRRSQKRCVEYVGDAGDAKRMYAFARDLGRIFSKYSTTLRASVTTGPLLDRGNPLSPRNQELLLSTAASQQTYNDAKSSDTK